MVCPILSHRYIVKGEESITLDFSNQYRDGLCIRDITCVHVLQSASQ